MHSLSLKDILITSGFRRPISINQVKLKAGVPISSIKSLIKLLVFPVVPTGLQPDGQDNVSEIVTFTWDPDPMHTSHPKSRRKVTLYFDGGMLPNLTDNKAIVTFGYEQEVNWSIRAINDWTERCSGMSDMEAPHQEAHFRTKKEDLPSLKIFPNEIVIDPSFHTFYFVTVTGYHFIHNAKITILIDDYPFSYVNSDNTGFFQTTIDLEPRGVGTYQVGASDGSNELSKSVVIKSKDS